VSYPLALPSWDGEELAALQAVIDSGRFTMGDRVRELEQRFADTVGSRFAVMVNSGSSANLLMAAALRYRTSEPAAPGDEIIVPAVGWATTYYPFAQLGFRLVLVDVEPDTYNLDPAALAAAIGPRTRAVCVVHALGNPCALDAITRVIAQANDDGGRIDLLEDTCEALGARFAGKQCGSHGAMGTYSFFFSHHISTMEGGMVVTDDADLAETLVCLRAHGWTRDLPSGSKLAGTLSDDPFDRQFRFLLPGYNVRPLELSAAVGLVQVAKIERFVEQRRRNAAVARELLAPFAGTFDLQRETAESSWFGFGITITGVDRRLVTRSLLASGIEHRPIITGNFARQPVLAHLDHRVSGPLSGADRIDRCGLFVGNREHDLTAELTLLASTLEGATERRLAA
jgi:CDP-6-deoxy-D-xylo-4-hexulose-3-dehydrase